MGRFPPVDSANEDGLLAIGGNLDVPTLTEAYSNGIFPWPVSEDFPLTWFAPDPRGALKCSELRVSKSLKKFLAKSPFEISFNKDFSEIVQKCANAKRKHEEGTWINEEIIRGYNRLFEAGKAYCVGSYLNGKLAGGLYGVCIGEAISGESMFYEKDNASKAALVNLVTLLEEKGIEYLDTQMVTPVVASMGGKEISRESFMEILGRLDLKRPRVDIFGS